MHPNPAFRAAPQDLRLDFARARGFGMLVVGGEASDEGGPLCAHVPFLVSPDGGHVEAHLARSNPILRALAAPRPALLAVTGPDGYVSPDWYGMADQVPTWNYVAVHLRGALERLPDEALRPHLDRLSAAFEGRLPKAPWTTAKMDAGALARMMRAIVPVRLAVASAEGTWKLSQNKPEAARLRAAEGVAGSLGAEVAALAALMRGPPA